jgi:hypothetical protein
MEVDQPDEAKSAMESEPELSPERLAAAMKVVMRVA